MESFSTIATYESDRENARDAWKKSTKEMIKIISNIQHSPDLSNYSSVLLENRDLKKQNQIAIAALDSIISENDDTKINKSISADAKTKDLSVVSNEEEKEKTKSMIKKVTFSQNNVQLFKDVKSTQTDLVEKNVCSSLEKNNVCKHQNRRSNDSFQKLRMLFNELQDNQQGVSQVSKNEHKEIRNKPNASPLKQQSDNIDDKNLTVDKQFLREECIKLKVELEFVRNSNHDLKNELIKKVSENDQLRDQIYSLELSLKTLTEAINLQDGQLSEYGSVVTTLKNSRSLIMEKMKEANKRNTSNILIMEKIEKQAEKLKCQLDTYNELLSSQSSEYLDKASSTESALVDNKSFDKMKEKDSYITLLENRLCEAIVDIKNKDREIKNHSSSVKSLIKNYEGERKCLEERLKIADTSLEKLEEHKIKQQETMKQLMKLIEFLQDKLEVQQK